MDKDIYIYIYIPTRTKHTHPSPLDQGWTQKKKGEREKEIGKNVKYWARPDIVNRIEEGSIHAYFEASLTEITETHIQFKTPQETHTIKNDFVLAMTGYQPNFTLLESLGVSFQKDAYKTPLYDAATMAAQEGVYLAGVVCGGLKTNKWFIENSRVHAPIIMSAIAARK